MEKERKAELWVGITVTAALLILVLGVLWGKGADLLSHQTLLVSRFDDVRGLAKGDAVSIRGIESGQVSGISLRGNYAEVRLRIKNGIVLYSDATVLIADKDLMGAKHVVLDTGKGPELFDFKQVLNGATQSNALDMLVHAQKLVAQADTILTRFRNWTEKGKMDRVFGNLENTSREASRILAENRQSIRQTASQLEEITRKLKEQSTVERIGKTVERMDSTLFFLNRIAAEAKDADGTLGRLIRDKKLYEHLVQTSADLDSLITDFKQDPKRYIHVSVF
jgi:phospholipid/cholesterol/gamma-HCH transport system substrate-binding protein